MNIEREWRNTSEEYVETSTAGEEMEQTNSLSSLDIKLLESLWTEFSKDFNWNNFDLELIEWLISEIQGIEDYSWDRYEVINKLSLMVVKIRLDQMKTEIENMSEFEALKRALDIKENFYTIIDEFVQSSINNNLYWYVDLEWLSSHLKERIDANFNNIESNKEKLIFVSMILEYANIWSDWKILNKNLFWSLLDLLQHRLSDRSNIERVSAWWSVLVFAWLWIFFIWWAPIAWISLAVTWLIAWVLWNFYLWNENEVKINKQELLDFLEDYYPNITEQQFEEIYEYTENNWVTYEQLLQLVNNWNFLLWKI